MTINNIFVNDVDVVTALENTFKRPTRNIRKIKPHRVKFNGKFITTQSGKTVWNNIGAAKNAIRLHLTYEEEILNKMFDPNGSSSYYTSRDIITEVMKQLEAIKMLEFVPVNDEMLSTTPRLKP